MPSPLTKGSGREAAAFAKAMSYAFMRGLKLWMSCDRALAPRPCSRWPALTGLLLDPPPVWKGGSKACGSWARQNGSMG